MEDRIINDKPEIPLPSDLNKVITEVHVFMNISDAKTSKNLRKLIVLTKRNSIPIFYYTDSKAFILQNKSKAFDMKRLIEFFKENEPDSSYTYRSRYTRDWLRKYRELYYKKTLDQLSEEARKTAYNISYSGLYKDDVVRSLSADLHNMKTGKNDQDRISLYKLLQIFKKEGYRTPMDFIDAMSEKWRNIYEEQ